MNTLIIKSNSNSFENFFLKKMNDNENVNVVSPFSSNSLFRKIIIYSNSKISRLFFNNEISKYIDEYDQIIIFDFFGYDILANYLYKKYDKRVIVWHWNILEEKTYLLNAYKRLSKSIENWTFDQEDAEKYNMKLNTQFYFYFEDISTKSKYDVTFIGSDKGRYEQISAINDWLIRNNFLSNIKILNRKAKRPLEYKKFLDYDYVLSINRQSKCLLEIVQDTQVGLTLRTLEAMFLNKKLITNNKKIMEYSFFNENNIFILDNKLSNIDNLLDFICNKNYQILDLNIKNEFCFQQWLKNFNS